ncbi:MAG TPA: diphthine--ammonia ligase [Candidatus Thermoplasmatota archaeon]|nr:diphthine--ammonia ligase [Candidatus Thermoplasmatota archaeon]
MPAGSGLRGPSPRCVALLSGGKDSVAAIEVAQQQGLHVVGALVLRPREDDAWMFHTPNLDAAAAVAACLGLAAEQHDVRAGQQQEVEDLQAALGEAARRFDADSLLSGALASEYQRVRIEAVAHRLGLRSFMPLWHKQPSAYVSSLAGAYDVRFSRTAAEGVPNAWAGERLTQERIGAMLRHPARPHVAGEGGEYETLVLDAPHYRHRLVVERAHVEATASRATWVVDAWRIRPKQASASHGAPP